MKLQSEVGFAETQNEEVYNAEEVRQWLNSFRGGDVRLTKDAKTGIASLVLEHEGKKNAFSGEMMVKFSDCIRELEKWPNGRGLILHGANGQFCSGGDLTFMNSIADPKSGSKMSLFMQQAVHRLAKLPLISVAYIEGHALGGGAELTMACDYRLMSPTARLGFVQARLGVTTGWGGATHLFRFVGYRVALRTLTSADIYSAEDAIKIGLIDAILREATSNTDDNAKLASEWLVRHLTGPPDVTKAYKTFMYLASRANLSKTFEWERERFATVWGGPAHKAALKKIFEK